MCLVGNCAEVLPELVRREVEIDVITDQTSAHDPLNGYIPAGYSLAAASALRQADPVEYVKLSMASMAVHVDAMLAMQRCGAVAFDYGNNIRKRALMQGAHKPSTFPDLCRNIFVRCSVRAQGRFAGSRCREIRRIFIAPMSWRWNCFRRMKFSLDWIHLARKRVAFSGTAGAHLLVGLWGARAHGRGNE